MEYRRKRVLIDTVSYRNDREVLHLITEGHFLRYGEGDYRVEFDASDMMGIPNASMIFDIHKPNRITMTTASDCILSQLSLEGQDTAHCVNDVDSENTVAVSMQQLQTDLGDDGGMMDLSYVVQYNYADTVANRIVMKIYPDAVPTV